MTQKLHVACPPQKAPVLTQHVPFTPASSAANPARAADDEAQPYSGDWISVLFFAFCFFLLLLLNLVGLFGTTQFR